MYIQGIFIILIVVVILDWISLRFWAASDYRILFRQIERLWKRIFQLDNQVYKLFEENQSFDTDKLAFGKSDFDWDLYHKISPLNGEIERTGKLIDALLDYYFYMAGVSGEEYVKSKRYSHKRDGTKDEDADDVIDRDDLFVERRNPFLTVQEALNIREQEIARENAREEAERIKQEFVD